MRQILPTLAFKNICCMQLYHTKKALSEFLDKKKVALGFVPTMGALHAGHLSLVKRAVTENPLTVVSIFVNPTQFNKTSDLQNYPRTLNEDLKSLLPHSDSIVVFAPSAEELYGSTIQTQSYNFGTLDKFMEGASRENHFQGVATIIEKLFSVVAPQKAYFGEKDFQQLQIVRALTHEKKWPITIVGCPIVREPNGLAMSSRNLLLSEDDKNEAKYLYKTLQWAVEKVGKIPLANIKEKIQKDFLNRAAFHLDYFCIANTQNLIPVEKISPGIKYRAFIAAYFKQIRLIDNMPISKI
jgi:pantoate--beta-alanine ligase